MVMAWSPSLQSTARARTPGDAVTRTASREPAKAVPFQPLRTFLKAETTGGVLLVAGAVIALVWVNLFPDSYHDVWETELALSLGGRELALTLHEWLNDGLMTLFFFVVGLEIKREIVQGELRSPRAAALPVMGALGGMVVPALIYTAFNAGRSTNGGWGVPMATDIAMAVGVLALIGRRYVPASLTVFLLALAIADDLGAIVVIAMFYSEDLSGAWLLTALVVIAATIAVRRLGIRPIPAYTVLGALLWFSLHESGVHATLAGVAMGFIAPTVPLETPTAIAFVENEDLTDPEALQRHVATTRHVISVVERLIHALLPWTSLVIVPIFAVANAGIQIDSSVLGDAVGSPVAWGVIVGLVVGKPLGITLVSFLAVKTGLAVLPTGVTWRQVAAVACVAGIGFTVAIFVADLAFADEAVLGQAKLGILFASIVAGLIGMVAVRRTGRAGLRSES
jgi:Na+:H+ antiporter, NhaA family